MIIYLLTRFSKAKIEIHFIFFVVNHWICDEMDFETHVRSNENVRIKSCTKLPT